LTLAALETTRRVHQPPLSILAPTLYVLPVGLSRHGLLGLAPGGSPSIVPSLHEAMGVSISFPSSDQWCMGRMKLRQDLNNIFLNELW
jgi:hypothetical protein